MKQTLSPIFLIIFRSILSLVGHQTTYDLNIQIQQVNINDIIAHLQSRDYFCEDKWKDSGLELGQRLELVRRHLKAMIPIYASNNFALLPTATIRNEEHEQNTTANQCSPNALYTVASLSWSNLFIMGIS